MNKLEQIEVERKKLSDLIDLHGRYSDEVQKQSEVLDELILEVQQFS